MAKLTEELREKILADFHVGKSQNSIAKKYELSTATINKLCKGVEPKHIEKVNTLTRINTELAAESEYEVNAVNAEVNDRVKHVLFFNSAAVRNVSEAMSLECSSQFEFKARAETILKGRETVLGKTADTAIQINNASSDAPKLEIVVHKG